MKMETLTWISQHLDCYHFHTPEALALKRKIEAWSVKSREEQGKSWSPLVHEFFERFANSPYDEQVALLHTHPGCEPIQRNAHITGASAEAYFRTTKNGNMLHYSMHPDGTEWRDQDCRYMNDDLQQNMLEYQKALHLVTKANYSALVDSCKADFKKAYAYILVESRKEGDKIITMNPSLFNVGFCLVMMVLGVAQVVKTWYVKPWQYGLAGFLHIILTVLLVGLLAISWSDMANTVIKGIYRIKYRKSFEQYEKKVTESITSIASLNGDSWFDNYSNAITRTKEAYKKNPGAGPSADETRALLTRACKSTSFLPVGKMPEPWKGYSRKGEPPAKGLALLLIVLVLTIII